MTVTTLGSTASRDTSEAVLADQVLAIGRQRTVGALNRFRARKEQDRLQPWAAEFTRWLAMAVVNDGA